MAKNKAKNQPVKGMYEGDVGTETADTNPLGFYNFALANEGRTGFNTAPDAWDYLQNQGFSNVYNQFENALGGNRDLQFADYLGSTYGAQRTPTAANPFAVNSALGDVVVNQQWGDPDGQGRRRRRR